MSVENEVFLLSAFPLHEKHKFASVHVVKAYGIMEVQLQLFISSALYGISIVKPTRCTIFRVLLNITLHVSDGLFVHHQES